MFFSKGDTDCSESFLIHAITAVKYLKWKGLITPQTADNQSVTAEIPDLSFYEDIKKQ